MIMFVLAVLPLALRPMYLHDQNNATEVPDIVSTKNCQTCYAASHGLYRSFLQSNHPAGTRTHVTEEASTGVLRSVICRWGFGRPYAQ